MGRETIDIQLTPEERSLLLRYGYPFEQIERALKNCEVSHAIEIVPLDCIELERLIGERVPIHQPHERWRVAGSALGSLRSTGSRRNIRRRHAGRALTRPLNAAPPGPHLQQAPRQQPTAVLLASLATKIGRLHACRKDTRC